MRVTPFLIALALGGCALVEPTLQHPPPKPGPATGPATSVAPTETPGPQAALPPLPVPPPKERPPQPIEPQKLVGLTQEETRRLIGAPATVHDEAPAVVWSYASNDCGLDVFFYLDMASQSFKALTYELKPKGPHGRSGSACLASLRSVP